MIPVRMNATVAAAKYIATNSGTMVEPLTASTPRTFCNSPAVRA